MQKNQHFLKAISLIIALIVFLSLFAQLSITIGMIPITGQTLAIGIIASIFSLRIGLAVVLGYLLFGALGLPIFANQKSGIDAILGATGGFLVGFIFYVIAVRACLNFSKTHHFYCCQFIGNIYHADFWLYLVIYQQRFIYDESDQCSDDSFHCARNHQIHIVCRDWL